MNLTVSKNSSDDKNYKIQLSTRIIKNLAHRVQQTDKLLKYDCRKTKFDSGSSLLWGISREDVEFFFIPIPFSPLSRFMSI